MLIERVASITSPFSQIGGSAMGRAVSRINPEATAIGEREVGFDLNLAAAWPPPVDPDPGRHIDWVREGWEALRGHSVGMYVDFLSDEATQASRLRTASA